MPVMLISQDLVLDLDVGGSAVADHARAEPTDESRQRTTETSPSLLAAQARSATRDAPYKDASGSRGSGAEEPGPRPKICRDSRPQHGVAPAPPYPDLRLMK